ARLAAIGTIQPPWLLPKRPTRRASTAGWDRRSRAPASVLGEVGEARPVPVAGRRPGAALVVGERGHADAGEEVGDEADAVAPLAARAVHDHAGRVRTGAGRQQERPRERDVAVREAHLL